MFVLLILFLYPWQQASKLQTGELDYDAKRYVMSVFYLIMIILIMIHTIYKVPNPLCKGALGALS